MNTLCVHIQGLKMNSEVWEPKNRHVNVKNYKIKLERQKQKNNTRLTKHKKQGEFFICPSSLSSTWIFNSDNRQKEVLSIGLQSIFIPSYPIPAELSYCNRCRCFFCPVTRSISVTICFRSFFHNFDTVKLFWHCRNTPFYKNH